MKLVLYSFIGCDPYVQDPNLFRHFLRYYKNKGVDVFNIILHSNENTDVNISQYIEIMNDYRITPIETVFGIPFYDIKVKLYKDIIDSTTKTYDTNDWFVYADGDEFIDTKTETFKEFIESECIGYNCVMGKLREYISNNKRLEKVDINQELQDQFCLRLNKMTVRKFGFGMAGKVCFTKFPYYIEDQAHHRPIIGNKKTSLIPDIKPGILDVKHYRWTSSFVEGYKKRIASKGCLLGHSKKIDCILQECINSDGKLPESILKRISHDDSQKH